MTTIWGDPIEVNGVCPGWLTKDDLVAMGDKYGLWTYEWETKPNGLEPNTWRWGYTTHIKLPQSHPYYTVDRHNKTHGTSFVYWQGGDEMPGDYGGGDVLFADGYPGTSFRHARWSWKYEGKAGGDIIGYTKKEEAEMTEETVWGDEIVVNGVRPEWLEHGVYLGYTRDGYYWFGPEECYWTENDIVGSRDGWNSVQAIKLRANHPHYSKTTDDLPPDWAIIKAYKLAHGGGASDHNVLDAYKSGHDAETIVIQGFAHYIATHEQAPIAIDPDLLLARAIVGDANDNRGYGSYAKGVRSGDYDDRIEMTIALAVIKAYKESHKL